MTFFSCFYKRFVSTGFFLFTIFYMFGALIRSIKHRRSVLEIRSPRYLSMRRYAKIFSSGRMEEKELSRARARATSHS